jgi:hypothetical protein
MQCNVEFGYQLSICSRIEENHGKRSSWILRRERERERKWVVVRDTTFGVGARNYISGLEGSQAVPACPSGIGNAYDRRVAL